MNYFKYFFLLSFFFSIKYTCSSQNDSISITDNTSAPNLFVRCSYCDDDYFRQEINFMNFVRHPDEADINILITTTTTASEGEEFRIVFEGNEYFKNRKDTLYFISKINDSEDIIRKGLVKKIKLGLLPFVYHSPSADNFSIKYDKAVAKQITPEDPWDHWIFQINTSGYFSGEKSSSSSSLWGTASVKRTTEDLKFEISYNQNYYEDHFLIGNTNLKSISKSNGLSLDLIPSINEHISAGFFASTSKSSYYNTNFSGKLSIGLEYNIYPYSLYTSRQLSFRYVLGYQYYDYFEETIYDKTTENLGFQKLSATYIIKETWGSISSSVSYSNYLYDFSKKNLHVSSGFTVYLLGGLSANLSGSFSMVHDQIYLPKAGAAPEEVILRRKALSTSYRYYCYFGLSYSFGSIYNNIVNPRF